MTNSLRSRVTGLRLDPSRYCSSANRLQILVLPSWRMDLNIATVKCRGSLEHDFQRVRIPNSDREEVLVISLLAMRFTRILDITSKNVAVGAIQAACAFKGSLVDLESLLAARLIRPCQIDDLTTNDLDVIRMEIVAGIMINDFPRSARRWTNIPAKCVIL